MANNFFGDIGTGIFKPVGDFVSGAVTGLQPGRVQQMELQRKRMQSLLDSAEGQRLLRDSQRLLNDARREAIEGGPDPIERAGKIGLAIERMDDAGMFDDNEKLKETLTDYATKDLPGTGRVDTAALFAGNLKGIPQETKRKGKWFDETISPDAFGNAAKKSINELVRKHGYSQEQATSLIQDEVNSRLGKQGKWRTLPEGPMDVRALFSEGISPFETPKAGLLTGEDVPRVRAKQAPAKQLEEYFQATTDTVPEENIPKTLEGIGITSPADQQAFQEMQKAVPELDLRREYEEAQQDPKDKELMDALIKRWKEGKLKKKELLNAFSKMQQKARESLGIA